MGTGENIGENTGLNTGTGGQQLAPAPPPPDNGDWQLEPGHYFEAFPWPTTAYDLQDAADTDLFVMFPRPNSETNSFARQRWAHQSMMYEVPVCVRGGAFPYHMEIDTTNTDPALISTITIGANHNSVNSYVVRIPAATIASLSILTDYDIYVKVTDQTGKEIKVWWSFQKEDPNVTAGAANQHFFFVDNTVANGDGLFNTPFNTLDVPGWLRAGEGAGSAQKILVMKQGNSLTTPYAKTAGWNWNSTKFPCGIIGIPDEEPVMDLVGTHVICSFDSGNSDDGFLWGFKAINGRTDHTDTYGAFTGSSGGPERSLIGNLTLEANCAFTNNGSNACALQWRDNGKDHTAMYDLRISNGFSGTDTNLGAVSMLLRFNKCLVDKITVSDWGTVDTMRQIFFVKRSCDNMTLRRITAIDNVNISGYGIDVRAGGTSTNMNNWEFTRLNFNMSGGTNGGINYIEAGALAGFSGPDGPVYINFNTLRGGQATDHERSCADTIDVRNNAASGNYDTSVDAGTDWASCSPPVPALSNNLAGVSAGDFNADGTLTDNGLAGAERGTRGHEIA